LYVFFLLKRVNAANLIYDKKVNNMRLRVLFLVFHGFSQHNGISKKIFGQVKGFRDCGTEVRLCYYDVQENGHRVWMVEDRILVDFGAGITAKLRKRVDYKALLDYIAEEGFSLLYMRSDHNANPFTIRLVRKIQQQGCKVLMEIPTFPYDQEYNTWRMRLDLCIDRLYRRRLAKELDAVVTFSDYPIIFGQKTIQISNGIDFDAIPLRQPIFRSTDDHTVHLLAVAEIHYWHGFDRLIHGLAAYNQMAMGPKVIFHLVGKLTGERERHEILVPIEQYGLQDQVILYGPIWGEQLDHLFDMADFAIGSLGRHRTGITVIRTLKNREYAARGISFAYSESDPDFDQSDYVLKIPSDDSPIDIGHILAFIKSMSLSPQSIRDSIQYLSWQSQMDKVLKAMRMI